MKTWNDLPFLFIEFAKCSDRCSDESLLIRSALEIENRRYDIEMARRDNISQIFLNPYDFLSGITSRTNFTLNNRKILMSSKRVFENALTKFLQSC